MNNAIVYYLTNHMNNSIVYYLTNHMNNSIVYYLTNHMNYYCLLFIIVYYLTKHTNNAKSLTSVNLPKRRKIVISCLKYFNALNGVDRNLTQTPYSNLCHVSADKTCARLVIAIALLLICIAQMCVGDLVLICIAQMCVGDLVLMCIAQMCVGDLVLMCIAQMCVGDLVEDGKDDEDSSDDKLFDEEDD